MEKKELKVRPSRWSEEKAIITRSSADADNGLDAFVGQSRSKNILNPFQVKFKKIIVNKK